MQNYGNYFLLKFRDGKFNFWGGIQKYFNKKFFPLLLRQILLNPFLPFIRGKCKKVFSELSQLNNFTSSLSAFSTCTFKERGKVFNARIKKRHATSLAGIN